MCEAKRDSKHTKMEKRKVKSSSEIKNSENFQVTNKRMTVTAETNTEHTVMNDI